MANPEDLTPEEAYRQELINKVCEARQAEFEARFYRNSLDMYVYGATTVRKTGRHSRNFFLDGCEGLDVPQDSIVTQVGRYSLVPDEYFHNGVANCALSATTINAKTYEEMGFPPEHNPCKLTLLPRSNLDFVPERYREEIQARIDAGYCVQRNHAGSNATPRGVHKWSYDGERYDGYSETLWEAIRDGKVGPGDNLEFFTKGGSNLERARKNADKYAESTGFVHSGRHAMVLADVQRDAEGNVISFTLQESNGGNGKNDVTMKTYACPPANPRSKPYCEPVGYGNYNRLSAQLINDYDRPRLENLSVAELEAELMRVEGRINTVNTEISALSGVASNSDYLDHRTDLGRTFGVAETRAFGTAQANYFKSTTKDYASLLNIDGRILVPEQNGEGLDLRNIGGLNLATTVPTEDVLVASTDGAGHTGDGTSAASPVVDEQKDGATQQTDDAYAAAFSTVLTGTANEQGNDGAKDAITEAFETLDTDGLPEEQVSLDGDPLLKAFTTDKGDEIPPTATGEPVAENGTVDEQLNPLAGMTPEQIKELVEEGLEFITKTKAGAQNASGNGNGETSTVMTPVERAPLSTGSDGVVLTDFYLEELDGDGNVKKVIVDERSDSPEGDTPPAPVIETEPPVVENKEDDLRHERVTNLSDEDARAWRMLRLRAPSEANKILGLKGSAWMNSAALEKAWNDGTLDDEQKAQLLDFARQRFDEKGHFKDVEGWPSAASREADAVARASGRRSSRSSTSSTSGVDRGRSSESARVTVESTFNSGR